MKLPSEDDLILYYYGEHERSDEIAEQLKTSPELAERFADIRSTLDAIQPREAPQRSDFYGHEVWNRVYPKLDATSRARSRSSLPKAVGWAVAATLVAMVAFWAGRETAPQVAESSSLSAEARSRIMLVAIAEHIERTQFLLLELSNGGAEIEGGELARELTAESRLYRQAAQRSGEKDVALLLEELERFLTEISHLEPGSGEQAAHLVERLEDNELLFKTRVIGSRLEERTKPTTTSPTT